MTSLSSLGNQRFISRFRNCHKGRLYGIRYNPTLRQSCSVFYFQSTECGLLTANQLEALRKTIKRLSRRFSRSLRRPDLNLRFLVAPYRPVAKKKKSARMGSSKAPFSHFIYPSRAGTILLLGKELRRSSLCGARPLRAALGKLPIISTILFLQYSSTWR